MLVLPLSSKVAYNSQSALYLPSLARRKKDQKKPKQTNKILTPQKKKKSTTKQNPDVGTL